MRKRLMIISLLFLLMFLNGCDNWGLNFTFTTGTAVLQTTTLPNTVNGTLTIHDTDYDSFATFESSSYGLDDIDAYNEVLLATRDKIRHSNVKIVTTLYRTALYFPYSTIVDSSVSGSGILFKSDDTYYYILTNHHVIDNKDKTATYDITTFEGTSSVEGTLIAANEDLDLAVIRILKTGISNVEIMDLTTRIYRKFNPGELVLAVGNPLSVVNNVTFGEYLSLESINNADFLVIYHSATIHEGSSGGALVDIDGNFLGINTWGSVDSDDQAFAVPNYIVYMFLVNSGLL